MKNLPLHWKIIIGMILGMIAGWIAIQFSGGKELIVNWVKPFGTIFIKALKLIAVPLILASLIKGITDLKDISKLSLMGGRTITTYIITTFIAVILGLGLVNILQPGSGITEETREQLKADYKGAAQGKIDMASSQQEAGPLQALIDLVPDNIFGAASDNGNMLQVIFFAIFFAIGLILIDEEKSRPVKEFFDSLNEIILKMIYSPIGVFGLLAALVAEAPNKDIFIALLKYSFTLLLGLVILIVVFYPLVVKFFTGKSYRFFFNGIAPAQLLAFSTSSSAATLPVTMERVQEHLGVDEEVASFVLPIGATVNMDGTSCYQAVAAVFIAQAYGLDLDLPTQLGIVMTASLASIGAAAVPSAGLVMLVIVLGQAGIPVEGLALIIAVDRPLDMVRTVVNVTGDATVSMLVAAKLGKLGVPVEKKWDDNYEQVA